MPEISLFKKLKSNIPTQSVDVGTVLGWIKNNTDAVSYLQDFIRKEKDEVKKKEFKNQLPAVTWSGVFEKRNKELKYVKSYSGIICIDIDKLKKKELTELITQLKNDNYIYSFFISPSGNGLKILYRTDATAVRHEEYFHALCVFITNEYGVMIDEACKDISRLCFLAYDPKIYINEQCEPITEIFVQCHKASITIVEPIPLENKPAATVGMDYLTKCDEMARKSYQPASGTYNYYITTFSLFANRYGIDENTTVFHLQSTCSAHDKKETKATVKSTYAKYNDEFGKWLDTGKKNTRQKYNQQSKQQSSVKKAVNDEVKFWYKTKNEKTGNEEYKFAYDNAIIFLENNGFCRFPMGNGFYQFIHVKNDVKQVDVIEPIKIKDFFLSYLKSDDSLEFKSVREMFRRGAKMYCSVNLLDGLSYFKPIFKKDTKDTAFVYFKNCYLEITADKVRKHSYAELDNFIWGKQVIDFEYKYIDYADSDFSRFAILAILGTKKAPDEWTELDVQKFESLGSTIGYLLHRYKNPSITKAVVAVDKRLRTSGENNGRTGKSLLSKGLGKMMNMCILEGKNFKFDKDFAFQKSNIDTELINFNDVRQNFDFERLFGMLTEEFDIEKKGAGIITMPFSDSPKFYISTNTTLKGGGESFLARQQIIEFSNFFTSVHQPSKEFGRMFFDEWDSDEWAKFYTYMIDCIKHYLTKGLITFPLENYEINKLIDTAGEEFIDYMNEIVLDGLKEKREFDNKILYDSYIASNRHRDKTQIKTFNKYIKSWAAINNLEVNAHLNGERDKRNNVTWLTFTTKPIS